MPANPTEQSPERRPFDALKNAIKRLNASHDEVVAERDAQIAALKDVIYPLIEFGACLPFCRTNQGQPNMMCDCGRDDAVKKAKAALEETRCPS